MFRRNDTPSPVPIPYSPSREEPRSLYNFPLTSLVSQYSRQYVDPKTHTGRIRANCLKNWLGYMGPGATITDWTQTSTEAFHLWVLEVRSKTHSEETANLHLSVLKHLDRVLLEQFHGFNSRTKGVKAFTIEELPPKGVIPDHYPTLMATAESMGLKHQFIISMLVYTGIRAQELVDLSFSQITSNLEFFLKVKSKGKKYRMVPIVDALQPVLRKWIVHRKDRAFNDNSLLGYSYETVKRTVKKVGLEAGLDITPHTLRHTFGHRMMNSTKDAYQVARAMGHESVNTTLKYSRRTPEELRDAMNSVGK